MAHLSNGTGLSVDRWSLMAVASVYSEGFLHWLLEEHFFTITGALSFVQHNLRSQSDDGIVPKHLARELTLAHAIRLVGWPKHVKSTLWRVVLLSLRLVDDLLCLPVRYGWGPPARRCPPFALPCQLSVECSSQCKSYKRRSAA